MNIINSLFIVYLVNNFHSAISSKERKFAPYIDVTLKDGLNWTDYVHKTGVKALTLAFATANSKADCVPTWGGFALNDKDIIKHLIELKELGVDLIVATGGASGPYLESRCETKDELLAAYRSILDTVGTSHLDVDIEAWFDFNVMNTALEQLQRERPQLTVSYTLVVAGDEFGLSSATGIELLQNAVQHNVRIDFVNIMAMEFWSSKANWFEAIAKAADTSVNQLKQIWPQKTSQQIYNMLGVTPMLGRNFNDRVFDLMTAKQLLQWAINSNIALLSFWSVGRDNGHCAGQEISAICSSIVQNDFEFSKIFADFKGTITEVSATTVTTSTTTTTTTTSTTTTTTTTTTTPHPSPRDSSSSATVTPVTSAPMSCENLPDNSYFSHETDCHKYYHCYFGTAHEEVCNAGTIWDNNNHACNHAELVDRPECK